MKLNEEKQLKQITDEFSKAVQIFNKKEYKKAIEMFDKIIEQFEDSEYYSVLEIQTRSKMYKNISNARVNPVRIKLTSDEDYLNEGIYNLNAGNLDRALELFSHLEKSKYKDPYLSYLFSLTYLKKEEIETSLGYLKKCIDKDDFYKVIAYNEPDFSTLFENEDFLSMIE